MAKSALGPARLASALALVALLVTGCQSGFGGAGTALTVPGGQVRLWCEGEGAPAIMFLAAIGGDDALVPIAERLADTARVCFYNRPGDGDTESPDQRRTAAGDAADLHALLPAAEIETPVVLVAHSYGALIAVIAAAEHPDEIAGVVLVDGSQPEAEAAMYEVMTDEQRAYFDGRLDVFPYIDWPTSLEQAQTAQVDFPDIPLTVITATRSFLEPCDEQLPCEDLQAVWIEAQEAYAQMTPDARHVLAATSHYVQTDDPDLVEAEIRALLDRLD